MKNCPKCGEAASIWRRNLFDGTCRNCRKAEAAQEAFSLSRLTGTGWILTMMTAVLILGLTIPFAQWLYQVLPQGNYPAELLAIPILILAGMFFCLISNLLKRCGRPVWKEPED